MDVEEPQAPVSPPLRWSTYFNDPSADSFLIHTTSDGLLLSLPRFILQAASHVFEDLLTIPQPPSDSPSKPYDGQNAPGILPEVRLQDVGGRDLEWALRLAHRDHVAEATEDLRDPERYWDEGSGPRVALMIHRILVIADKFALNGIVPILFDTLAQPDGFLLKHHFLEVLAVAFSTHHISLALQAFKNWAEDEKDAIRERANDGVEQIAVSGEPPDWREPDFPFDTTSVQHTNDWIEDKAPTSQYGAFETRAEEEPKLKLIWRWRPRHVSDLGDEFLDLIPNDVLRLLLKEETLVLHSSLESWDTRGRTFIYAWKGLASFVTK